MFIRMRILGGVCGAMLAIIPAACPAAAPQPGASTAGPASDRGAGADYLLGPGDQVKIWALGVEEIPDRAFRIGADGRVDLPVIGRVDAQGLTVEQFRRELIKRLESQVWKPQVSVEVVEFGSQPVTVLGAVMQPGLHQLQGRKTLAEILSLAGGLRPDAGYNIRITRSKQFGAIPLDSAHWDPSGEFSVAEVSVKGLLTANDPAQNIMIQPHDVVTVPTAGTVYVIGTVTKPGAIVLNERETISVLQALSMAQGLAQTAKPQDAKILRTLPGNSERTEIPVDLKRVLEGRAEDVSLRANDILFVPDSTSKKVAVRALEAMVQTATGLAIWHP